MTAQPAATACVCGHCTAHVPRTKCKTLSACAPSALSARPCVGRMRQAPSLLACQTSSGQLPRRPRCQARRRAHVGVPPHCPAMPLRGKQHIILIVPQHGRTHVHTAQPHHTRASLAAHTQLPPEPAAPPGPGTTGQPTRQHAGAAQHGPRPATAGAAAATLHATPTCRAPSAACAHGMCSPPPPHACSRRFFLMTSAYQLADILGMRSSVCMST